MASSPSDNNPPSTPTDGLPTTRGVLGEFSGEDLVLSTPQQARLLSRESSLAVFCEVLARDRSAGQVAAALGWSVERVLYHLRGLLAAGLVRETGRLARAGRPLRLYRSAADSVLTPFGLTPFVDPADAAARRVHDAARRESQAMGRLLTRLGWEARRLYRDARSGEVMNEAAPSDAAGGEPFAASAKDLNAAARPPAWDFDARVRLTGPQAEEIRARLQGLWEQLREYRTLALAAPVEASAREFQVRVTLLPLD